jgi:hypothetical protein
MEAASAIRVGIYVRKMKTDRKTAMVAGLLFILATVFSLASTIVTGPILAASDYLVSASSNANQMVLGVLLLLGAAVSVTLIPAALFPVLKRHSESKALGYFGIRTLEAVTMVIGAVSLLALVSSGQEYVKAGVSMVSAFQASGTLWLAVYNWTFWLDPIVFGVGGLLLYDLLYIHRLVPRWLSLWGIMGVVLVMAFGMLQLFGSGPIYLALPIAVQEMAMAAWFIVKGIDPTTIPAASTS